MALKHRESGRPALLLRLSARVRSKRLASDGRAFLVRNAPLSSVHTQTPYSALLETGSSRLGSRTHGDCSWQRAIRRTTRMSRDSMHFKRPRGTAFFIGDDNQEMEMAGVLQGPQQHSGSRLGLSTPPPMPPLGPSHKALLRFLSPNWLVVLWKIHNSKNGHVLLRASDPRLHPWARR
jgi:hypothetical protein